ncbi:MAG: c-type cytochrome [Nitrospirales bacterium]|nr:c-type cytochrome [Nitrospira sp.]MDR4500195.1 c-type cytochrome [Nitrospirales bacterium]
MKTVMLFLGLSMMATLFTAGFALAVNPTGYGQAGGEFDIRVKRVPQRELAAAKKMKPPFTATPEILAEGKKIFLGTGGCISCHGPEGKGDGGAASNLPIQPRNFTNKKFKKYRTLGELMWVLKNGSMGQSGKVPGTGMLPVVQPKGFISETDGWKVLLYERSLGE